MATGGWPDGLVRKLAAEIFKRYSTSDALLTHRDYEKYCRDIYFCLELSPEEWNEQCDGLGALPSKGVGFEDFVKLYTDFGR